MKRYTFLFVLLTGSSLFLSAQELTGSLTVEGTYQPVVRDHNRLSGQPVRLTPQLPHSSLDVSLTGVYSPVLPGFSLFEAADESTRLPQSYDGYVQLISGSWLNTSLSAGYRFVNTKETKIGAWLQHNSTSFYRPAPLNDGDPESPRRKSYDQTIGIYGTHSLGDAGTLSADVAYHLGYFNYCTNLIDPLTGSPYDAPTQTLNDFRIGAKWQNNQRPDNPLIADAGLSYRYFGYRRLYESPWQSVRPMRENDFMPSATIGYRIAPDMTAALAADAHILFYNNRNEEASRTNAGYPESAYPIPYGCTDNYGIIGLTPAWTYNIGKWSLRAGARVDLSWGIGSGFSSVHAAPDVALNYSSGYFTGSLTAKGGVMPNTLAAGSEEDYYQCPTLVDNLPVYTPFDMILRFGFGDFRGFTAGLRAGYAVSRNTPVKGWYPFTLFSYSPLPDATLLTAGYTPFSTLSLKGFTLGANLGFTWGDMLDITGDISYQHQKGRQGYYNGADRPRWVIDINAVVKPVENLNIGAGFVFRGARGLWLAKRQPEPEIGSGHNFIGDTEYYRLRLPDISNLRVFASYTLAKRYTFSLEARNIFGSEESLNPLLPTDGFNILGGVSILF